MSNNSKKTKKKANRLLLELGLWARNLHSLQEIDEMEDLVDEVHESFLCSSDADDYELRNGAILIHNQVKDLFAIVKKASPRTLSAIDTIIEEQDSDFHFDHLIS